MELFNEPLTGREADLYRPLLAYLRGSKGASSYTPRWALMPLPKLCQLALLWKQAGFVREAGELAAWLKAFAPFPSLWCPEKEFDEEKTARMFSKLQEIPPLASAAGFDCNVSLMQTAKVSAALTWDGHETALGAIRAAGFEIRAFGPQAERLPFGIIGKGMNGWARAACYPEVWLEMKGAVQGEGIKLNFRFVGVQPECPLSLVFYVVAPSCEVEKEILKPKTLRRFLGETAQVQFERKGMIVSDVPQKVQIIPLAGETCFWGATFLLSYPIHPWTSQIALTCVAK
ncbi:MAG: hypothetical protein KGR16_05405 [Verrucomicrobia bacterium]|nr:hypothetical protein [Verrucomicrobiota bacterium]MDE3047091.1 hypothetical protein [Verrucomicrobiota bacterium]